MVFYYTTSDGHTVYKGKDKYENEELIKYAFPEDVWFHVDDLSSAHVYFRLAENEKWDAIDQKNINQVCQLLKENSIEGCKKAKVDIIYTPASNLKKTQDMEVGAVGYKNDGLVKKIRNVEKDKVILKTIEKTEQWMEVNLQQLLLDYEVAKSKKKQQQYKDKEKQRKVDEQLKRQEAEKKSYKLMEVTEYKTSNKDNDDDDFM